MERSILRTTALCITVLVLWSCATPKSEEERFIDGLLSRMTIEEKIGQMNQLDPSWSAEEKEALIREGKVGSIFNVVGAREVNRLQRMAVEESRLGIPLIAGRDVIHGFHIIYPIPLGQAATWNPELVEQASSLTAQEAVNSGVRWTFSPMVDVARDPRWGRVAEGYGEDSYLTSVMAGAVVRGYQRPKDSSEYPMTAACVKHFAGYSASEGGRDYNTTWIPETQLRDVYLPPFKSALEAGAMSVMCSFNDLNGLPSSANAHLNIDILRHEWGSEALLVSDWGSGSDLVPHGLCGDKKEAALRCVNARMEMDMQGNIYTDYLAELVREGQVTEKQIDECVRSILRMKYRLGLFEHPYAEENVPDSWSEASLEVATEMAAQSAILLKNDGVLPLSGEGIAERNILICGPLADQKKEQLGTWVFDGDTSLSVTPLAAFCTAKEEGGLSGFRLLYEAGLSYSRAGVQELDAHRQSLLSKAQQADVILYFAGEEAILSGEARCRANLDLPGAQAEMMDVLVSSGKPVVLVVMAGRPLTIGRQASQAAAVLYAYHGGSMAGEGLRKVITGEIVPSGKTTMSFPKMAGQVPLYYNRHNTGRPSYDPPMLIDSIPIGCPQFSIGQSSYWLETPTEPLYPFGYGLSYTTFAYSPTEATITEDSLIATCVVRNTGGYDAYETVQLYTHQKSGALVRPIKELKGFEKVFIPASAEKAVRIAIPREALGYWHEEKHDCTSRVWFATDEAEYEVWLAPDSRCQSIHGAEVSTRANR